MIGLIRKNITAFGIGKVIVLFAATLVFSLSLRVGNTLSFEQHLLSALSDHYYLIFFFLPLILFACFSFSEDDPEYVILRFHSYHRYFFQKWLGIGIISALIVLIQCAAILVSAVGLKRGNLWALPAGSLDTDLFHILSQPFQTPLTAFFACCIYEFLGIWLIAGLSIWLTHFTGHKWTVRIMVSLYILSILWIKVPAFHTLPVTGFNHLLILHHNLGLTNRWIVTGITVLILLMLIILTVRFQVKAPLRRKSGITAYYRKALMQKQNLWILCTVVLGITAYKGFRDPYLTSGQEWIYDLFSGHGTGMFHVLSFLEMLIVNTAPLYLLAVFVEHSISDQSIFVAIRTRSRREILHGILQINVQFIALYSVLWFLAGIAGGLLWSHTLDADAILFLLGCVGVKFLDILLQSLVMLVCYLLTKQITVGFLTVLGSNLLCVIPQKWGAFLPFGLSSTVRMDWISLDFGIPVWSAIMVLVVLVSVLLVLIESFGTKKL